MGTIHWKKWDATGRIVEGGQMPLANVGEKLAALGREARQTMKETGADHVIYGMMICDPANVIAVHFYMWPLDDKNFRKVTGNVHNSVIYAAHNMRSVGV